jgi:hypothetical protein
MTKMKLLSVAVVATFLFFSCDKDDTTCDATYEGNVKSIIDKSCAYVGCHSGGTDAGMWVPEGSKDYTNYEGMVENLTNGTFTKRALELRNMPDTMWTPDDRPQILSESEIEILTCWKDNDFPKN